jgi:acetyl esterase/lipase
MRRGESPMINVSRFAIGRALFLAFAMIWLVLVPSSCGLAQDAFYRATSVELAGPPGTLIRQERMRREPRGGTAYRVLYRSSGLKGESIAVSGVVIVPDGPVPPGGRPILAWAHPTTGIVSRCAPSLAFFLFQQIQGLRDMLGRGYVVTATDYPGLGTPGPHPYLVGVSEGRAVLDSIRAAGAIVGTGASNRAALWGHSQGGQAVLYAGLIAKSYAPELHLVGIAAAAPATDLGTLLKNDLDTPGGKNLLAMTLWSWAQVFGAPMDEVVVPAALPVINRLANTCLESPVDILPRRADAKALAKRFLRVDNLTEREPWRSLLAENTVGAPPPSLPIFVAQGDIDDTVVPAVTRAYVGSLCAHGSAVRMMNLPRTGHAWIARDSAASAMAWISDRFAGLPAPSDCKS